MPDYPPVVSDVFDDHQTIDTGEQMNIVDQFKKGWKTSEFWVGVLLIVAPPVSYFAGVDVDTEGLATFITSAVTGVSYIVGRTWLKTKRVEALSFTDE